MASLRSIITPRTAHVYYREMSREPSKIILALHGYAQSANDFLSVLDAKMDHDVLVVAPEGLSKFYLEGISGAPVASWMTRLHRQDEIKDYIAYLDLVLQQIRQEYPNTPIHALGFSQGVPTLCRWLSVHEVELNSVILSGSIFPKDIPLAYTEESKLKNHQIFFQFGNEDRLLDKSQVEEFQALSQKHKNINVTICEGRHQLFVDHIKQIINQ